MGRLSIVIADYDAEYIQNLEKFLITNHPRRFEISSFSAVEPLNAFLGELHKTDILLVNGQMYKEVIRTENWEMVLILSENEAVIQDGIEAVYKFQHIDILVSEVIRFYSLRSKKDCPISGNEGTHIISVVSPAGGTGKSTIAAGCSIMSAGRGLRSFYLNLEDIPSTEVFFHGDTKQSFSNVIYQLKGSSGGIWLKLEAARCIDSRTGVHFFRPPESILDMNELNEEDISRLILEFKRSSAYNAVFIDLPSGLNGRNSSVLKHSDIILLVLSQDARLQNKTDKFYKALELFDDRLRTDFRDKVVPILNFSKRQSNAGSVFGYKPIVDIADHSGSPSGNSFIKPVENPAFLADLNKVIEYIMPAKKPVSFGDGAVASWDGGEYIAL